MDGAAELEQILQPPRERGQQRRRRRRRRRAPLIRKPRRGGRGLT